MWINKCTNKKYLTKIKEYFLIKINPAKSRVFTMQPVGESNPCYMDENHAS